MCETAHWICATGGALENGPYYGGTRSGVTIRIGSDPYYYGNSGYYGSSGYARGYYDRWGRFHYYR